MVNLFFYNTTFMLSSAQIKQVKSLQQKKFRQQLGIFVAETPKVCEVILLSQLEIENIYATEQWWNTGKNNQLIHSYQTRHDRRPGEYVISEKELERISGLKTPNQILMIVRIPEKPEKPRSEDIFQGCSLVLDNINDPGNLGTIIRMADWFAINRIIASQESADPWQPKCVQASMGSVSSIPVIYLERSEITRLMNTRPTEARIYGTFLEGENIYSCKLDDEAAWYIIGNEAHGIGTDWEECIDKKITIPSFEKPGLTGAESLNAAMATAILCSEIKGGKFRD